MSTEQAQIGAAIAAPENQRSLLSRAVVDRAVGLLKAKPCALTVRLGSKRRAAWVRSRPLSERKGRRLDASLYYRAQTFTFGKPIILKMT